MNEQDAGERVSLTAGRMCHPIKRTSTSRRKCDGYSRSGGRLATACASACVFLSWWTRGERIWCTRTKHHQERNGPRERLAPNVQTRQRLSSYDYGQPSCLYRLSSLGVQCRTKPSAFSPYHPSDLTSLLVPEHVDFSRVNRSRLPRTEPSLWSVGRCTCSVWLSRHEWKIFSNAETDKVYGFITWTRSSSIRLTPDRLTS